MNTNHIRREFESKVERGWEFVYIMVDLHNTIIAGTKDHSKIILEFTSNECKEVLQWFSKRRDVKLILWTSSKIDEITRVMEWLEKNGITFDYVNHNPECKNTAYAEFDKKPYFNILIDDRAGFDAEVDWAEIRTELRKMKEWDKIS